MKISKQDFKFVPVDPDPNFDPEHNKKVIEDSIKANELLRARKKRESDEKVKERTTAISQYLSDVNRGATKSGVLDYFGRHEIARLRGEEIIGIIKSKIGDVTKQKIKEQAKVHASKF